MNSSPASLPLLVDGTPDFRSPEWLALSPGQRRYRLRKLAADRHACGSPQRNEPRHAQTRAAWPGPCAYLDGEAFGSDYRLLQIYQPETGIYTRQSPQVLTTEECLQALYAVPKALLFGFGLGYDISNWLRDLPRETYGFLRRNNWCRWRSYKIEFIPSKLLKIIDYRRSKGDKLRQVYDLYPFFQQPFLRALESASVPIDPIIAEGKRLRGRFTDEAFVKRYNEAELRAMELMHRWLIDCLRQGDLRIRYWTGPGACARHEAKRKEVSIDEEARAAFLANRRDLSTAGTSLEPDRSGPWAACVDAFYGGRFELSRLGPVDACWEYDLSSAYPWALASGMPCFACGGEWQPGMGRWTISQVAWQPKGASPMWGPFPNRMTRNLAWTVNGCGWYHEVEIAAALEHLSPLYQFRRLQSWHWEPSCNHDPWSWVRNLAEERVACKHSQPGKAQALKLVLNSLYGICCDKAGVVNGRVPLYHNPYWAGLVTARTRARLLEAAGVGGESIVYLATDGVHSTVALDLPTGNSLGDWEPPSRAGVPAVFLAPGTYIYADGKRGKSRGVPLGAFPSDIRKWLRLWRMTAPYGEINLKQRHFVSLTEARSRSVDDARYHELKNTWTTRPRTLSYDLHPRRTLRADGRWIAPTDHDWQIGAACALLPHDQEMIREEEWASYQPEWAAHSIDGG